MLVPIAVLHFLFWASMHHLCIEYELECCRLLSMQIQDSPSHCYHCEIGEKFLWCQVPPNDWMIIESQTDSFKLPEIATVLKKCTTKFDKSAQNQFETSDLRCLLWNKLENQNLQKLKLDSQVNVDLRISKIIKFQHRYDLQHFQDPPKILDSVVLKSFDYRFEMENGSN